MVTFKIVISRVDAMGAARVYARERILTTVLSVALGGVWKLEARVRGFIWAVRRLKWDRMVNCIRLLAVEKFRNTRENCVPAATAIR
jgi:hypothetical protein